MKGKNIKDFISYKKHNTVVLPLSFIGLAKKNT
jgi:hypothetical protein